MRTLLRFYDDEGELESLVSGKTRNVSEKEKDSPKKYYSFDDLGASPLTVAQMVSLRRDFEAGAKGVFPSAPDKLPYSVYGYIMSYFDEPMVHKCTSVSSSMRDMLLLRGNECTTYIVDPDAVVASMRTRVGGLSEGVTNAAPFEAQRNSSEIVLAVGEIFADEQTALLSDRLQFEEDTCGGPNPEPVPTPTTIGVVSLLVLIDLLLVASIQQLLYKVFISSLSIVAVVGVVMWTRAEQQRLTYARNTAPTILPAILTVAEEKV